MQAKPKLTGAIAWMASNSVAANLLMMACLIGGLFFMSMIQQEVFPEFEIDIVQIQVIYPGASPEEIESGILLVIEDAVVNVDGIDEVKSVAKEGSGVVRVSVISNSELQQISLDIEKEINRITTFPDDAEPPQISIMSHRRQVVNLSLFGAASAKVLHELGEEFRQHLLLHSDISHVELAGIQPREMSIEISQDNLRRYKISLAEISLRIKNASLDLPGGSIKTQGGEILIRMKERKDYSTQFAQLPIINSADGSEVLLGQIATIKDGYAETDYSATFNGKPAIMLKVYGVGSQTPIEVSDAVKVQIDAASSFLPKSIKVEIRYDTSKVYAQRVDLLMRNSAMGLALVFILLAIFLELRLAFWVMMGIPIAFLGAFLVLPFIGVTLNMITLFAFIVALGIVVDDAIVIGENIYHYRQDGFSALDSAILGAQDMAKPVTFSILTNITTFIPLLFIPGMMGKIFFMIPLVISTVFLLSLIESLFVLPHHLAHLKPVKSGGFQSWYHKKQQRFSHAFRNWVVNSYGPVLDLALRQRYIVIVTAFAILFLVLSYALSGRMGMSVFPKTESDFVRVSFSLPYGSAVEKTQKIADHLINTVQDLATEIPNGDKLLIGVYSEVGSGGSHNGAIKAYVADPEIREKIMSTAEFGELWREKAGAMMGLDTILFESDAGGPGGGAALTVELNHRNIEVLAQASSELAEIIRAYPIAKDVDDGFSKGKQQLDFTLLPEGKSLGFTASNVARQIRNAFYGSEVLRQQRGRDEIKVMVRLPKDERILEQNIHELLLWTPNGKEIPLTEVVTIKRGWAYTEIKRRNGNRNVQVTADVSPRSKAGEIINDLTENEFPTLLAKYPGLNYSFEGQQADMADSLGSLKSSFVVAILVIYALLAIPFQSYILPLIVIMSIPFGVIGAIMGHVLMGYDLSILSLLGIIALSGIVVNDSLVLIDYANQLEQKGDKSAFSVIKMASIQRFRPIFITTVTTFCGLFPMILETSRQAKILIPMAISIGFGILFATLITLFLIPALYLFINDVRVLVHQCKVKLHKHSI